MHVLSHSSEGHFCLYIGSVGGLFKCRSRRILSLDRLVNNACSILDLESCAITCAAVSFSLDTKILGVQEKSHRSPPQAH